MSRWTGVNGGRFNCLHINSANTTKCSLIGFLVMDVDKLQLQAIGQLLNSIERTSVVIGVRLGELEDQLANAQEDLRYIKRELRYIQEEIEAGGVDLDGVNARLKEMVSMVE